MRAITQSIMHLVNQESVILETMDVVKNGLARELGVNPEEVKVKIDFDGNTLNPAFSVDKAVLDRLSDDDVKNSMAKVWFAVRDQMAQRLNGLSVRRYG